jgi:GH24 family phage-related lysozyme (muramidase)
MILDNKGYLLITKFEGLKLKPYLCSAKDSNDRIWKFILS